METITTSARLAERTNIPGHYLRVCNRYPVVEILPVAVLLVVGIREESEADSLTRYHHSFVRLACRVAAPDRTDSVRPQPSDRVFDPMSGTISRMVVGRRCNRHSAKLQSRDHFRRCMEDQPIVVIRPFVRKRRFEIDERDVRR